jgi:hypothetical protein
VQTKLAAKPRATPVDLKHELCNETDQCRYRKDNTLFYLDCQHLSTAGADHALRDFHIPPATPRKSLYQALENSPEQIIRLRFALKERKAELLVVDPTESFWVRT